MLPFRRVRNSASKIGSRLTLPFRRVRSSAGKISSRLTLPFQAQDLQADQDRKTDADRHPVEGVQEVQGETRDLAVLSDPGIPVAGMITGMVGDK